MLKWFAAFAACVLFAPSARADDDGSGPCSIPGPVVRTVQAQLANVIGDGNGGLFTPNRMWAAVVDRQGRLCSVVNSGNDPWPGSRAIAIAKASTANDFSNSGLALSTANIYGPTQPGGSLYGLNNSNPYNAFFDAQGSGLGQVPGGIITFGGGVALYSGGHVIGGLGVSGDTSCADHSIAWRMRKGAGLDGTPNSDNISYFPDGPSGPVVNPSQFSQPHCLGAKTDVIPK